MPDKPHYEPVIEVPSHSKPNQEKQSSPYWLPPDEWKAANEIADRLNETQPQARRQVVRIIKRLSLAFAQSILEETLTIESQGGMMLPDGSRRRTPGGVFFYRARERMPEEVRAQIFRPYWAKQDKPAPSAEQLAVFTWDERKKLLAELLLAPGEATKAKVVLIGEPTNIESYSGYVTFKLTSTNQTPSLPKGVPKPALEATRYTVYMSSKHWSRVEEVATNAEDSLIIEGVCVYDAQKSGMALYATSVTSKQLEVKKREQKARG